MFLFQLSFCFCFRKTNKEFALKIISKAKVKGKVSLISRWINLIAMNWIAMSLLCWWRHENAMLGDSLPNLDFMQSTSSLLEPVRLADDTKRFIGVESKTSKLNPHKYYCVDLKYNIKLRTHLRRALKFSRLNQPCSPKFRKLFCQLLLQLAQTLSLFKAKSMTSVYFSVYSGKNSHPQFWCMLWIFFFFSGTYGWKWNQYIKTSKTQEYCRTHRRIWNTKGNFPCDGTRQGNIATVA